MESRIIELYDYHRVDISEFRIHFKVNEERIADEMKRLVNRKARWKSGEEIFREDMVELSLQSDIKKYNRERLQLAVGSNLFDAELEHALIGMKQDEVKEVELSGGKVLVKVLGIKNKVVPKLTDELVKEYGPEGIDNQKELWEYLVQQQKEEAIDEVVYQVEQKILNEVFEKSEFLIKQKDFRHVMELQLNRYAAISENMGLDLKTMTKEDFEGKIPVGSYYELIALLYENSWEYIEEYLAGEYYAKEDGVDVSEKAYEEMVQEYADYWKESLEQARKINCYEEFVVNQNKACFFKRIRKYYQSELLREDENYGNSNGK